MVKNLAKHIEILLLDNECVIIPQFGGFVTQLKDVTYVDEESLFMPPCRTVGFNEKLQGNDGLLVASFMDVYGVSESEAKRMIHSEVLEMRQQLLENGSYDFGTLGLLNQDEDGELTFSPCAAGVLTPDYYGLDALEFPRLQIESGRETVFPHEDHKPLLSQDERGVTINISHRAVHQIATVAAAILLFFFFATPIRNVDVCHSEAVVGKSVMLASSFLIPQMSVDDFYSSFEEQPDILTPDTTTVAADSLSSDFDKSGELSDLQVATPRADQSVATVEAEKQEIAVEKAPVKKEKPEQKTSVRMAEEYGVVVASSIPEENAIQLIHSLEQQGITGASLYKKGKMVRVVFRGYETETDAQAKKNKLRTLGGDFQSAWILKLN